MKNILLANCDSNSLVVVRNKNSTDTQKLFDTYVKNFPESGEMWKLSNAASYSDAEYFIFRPGGKNSIAMSYTGMADFKERERSFGFTVTEYTVEQLCGEIKGIKKKLDL